MTGTGDASVQGHAKFASVYNHFNQERGLSSRDIFKANRAAALAEWRGLCAE